MKKLGASIIVISPNPDENLQRIKDSLKKQVYSGKKEIIIISQKKGLAENMNDGIKKAKNEIVITLHGDCIPSDDYWLNNLLEPFKDKEVVATVSKVQMPEDFWEKMNSFEKALSVKERGVITPLLDEKGCAYRASAMKKVGYFEENLFKTAGEDFDIYIKLSKIGRIEYPNATVVHRDFISLNRRIKKTYRNAEGFGTLVRIYGRAMPGWYLGFLKAIPLIGLGLLIPSYPILREIKYYPNYLFMLPIMHGAFIYGFWRGFFTKKQRAIIV